MRFVMHDDHDERAFEREFLAEMSRTHA